MLPSLTMLWTFPSYGSANQCGVILNNGKRFVAGYEDGSVRVFDLKTGQVCSNTLSYLAYQKVVMLENLSQRINSKTASDTPCPSRTTL